MLSSMKIGERGQVTIPKPLRDRLGLRPGSEVRFILMDGHLILAPREPYQALLERFRGQGKGMLRRLGVRSVDQMIELLRGR